MRLEEMKLEDLIDPDWLDRYKKETTALWWQLVRLNANLFILKKLADFPFQLLGFIRQPFWDLVRYSLFEASVMIIWRVALDTDPHALTLRRLKNSIVQNLREEKHRSQLKRLLRKIDFEGAMSDFEPRVRDLRHKLLAHMDRDLNVDPRPEQIKQFSLYFADLAVLQDKLNSLFELLCFSEQRLLLPIDYHPEVRHPPGVETRPDIERLLDCAAKESALLNMPERQREVWPLWRKNLSPEELEVLNKYRVKFGLPEA